MGKKKLEPVHPGEILLEEFLVPLGMSQNALARGVGVQVIVGDQNLELVELIRRRLRLGDAEQADVELAGGA